MRVVLLVLLSALAACGPTEEEKKKTLLEVENGVTSADAQAGCNAKGRFYHSTENKCMDDVFVAAWDCTRGALTERVLELNAVLNPEELAKLDDQLAAGFRLHQCGETVGEEQVLFAFTILKSWVDDENAQARAGVLGVTGVRIPTEN